MQLARRSAGLDFLRGTAILLVLGAHFTFHARPGSVVGFIELLWRRFALVGVDLFFVLSGFLIGSLLLSEMDRYKKLHIGRFLIRRGFKLYPVYYIFIFYSILVPAIKAWHGGGDFFGTIAGGFREFSTSLIFMQNYIPPNPAAHTWSLAVEEHFYLTLPFVIAGLGPVRLWKWLLPICLAAIPLGLALRVWSVLSQQAQSPVENGILLNTVYSHLHFDALLSGVGLAVIAFQFPEQFIRLGRFPKSLIAGGLALWALAVLPQEWVFFWGTLGFTLRIMGSAALIVGVCRNGGIFDKRGLLAWIGVNSYAIYVWHITLMGITKKYLLSKFVSLYIHDPSTRYVVMALGVTAAVVAGGAIMTRLIELPALALRDRWFPSRGRAIVLPRAGGEPAISSALEQVAKAT